MYRIDCQIIPDDMLIEMSSDSPFECDGFDNSVPDIRKGCSLRNVDLHKTIILLCCERDSLVSPLTVNDMDNISFYINNFWNDMVCWLITTEDEFRDADKESRHITELMQEAKDQDVSIRVREKARDALRANEQGIRDAMMLMEHFESIFNITNEIFDGLYEMMKIVRLYNIRSAAQLIEEFNCVRRKVLPLICETDRRFEFMQSVADSFEKNCGLREQLLQLFLALKSEKQEKTADR